MPPADQVERVDEYSAVALFVQSARRVQAGFVLRAEERLAVARICRLVEGMPLAIELAAAWARVLSCAEIAREIERTLAPEANLEFLAASMRDVPERHRSMRAVIDHSWKLLSDDEQCALRQLAVFRGGFTREAAERVAGALLALPLKALHVRPRRGGSLYREVVAAPEHVDGHAQAHEPAGALAEPGRVAVRAEPTQRDGGEPGHEHGVKMYATSISRITRYIFLGLLVF